MDDPEGPLAAIVIALQLVGFILIVGTGMVAYRNSIRAAERQRLNALPPVASAAALSHRLRAGAEVEPADEPLLQEVARQLLARRPYLIGLAGAALAYGPSLLLGPSPARVVYIVMMLALVLFGSWRVWRDAGRAEVFLRDHPAGEQR